MKALKIVFALFCILPVLNITAQVKKTPIKKRTATPLRSTITKTAPVKKIPGIRVKLITDSGLVIIRLYDSTPLHRDNFVKLVKEHFYDSLLFHRVINGFMIQGGDPLSKNALPGQMLGTGGGGMDLIPAEFRQTLIHKKGVLAAARMGDDVNPQKASSACQFYIVQGKKYTDEELNNLEMQMGRKFLPVQRMVYKTVGGTPFLDMNYTVYGEVEKGIEIIDKIAAVPTQPGNRPVGDIRMKMELLEESVPHPAKKL